MLDGPDNLVTLDKCDGEFLLATLLAARQLFVFGQYLMMVWLLQMHHFHRLSSSRLPNLLSNPW